MPRFLYVMLGALLLTAPVLAAQPSGGWPGGTSGLPLPDEQAAVDITFYNLALTLDPEAKRIDGTLGAEMDVVHPTAALLFDLHEALDVAGVRDADGAAMPFEREDGRVRLHLGRTAQPGERLAVEIAYGGVPREAPRPPWDGGLVWSETEDGRPWVAVACQINGADLWWPTKDQPSDEPDSVRIALTGPADLKAIANGRLDGRVENGDGTATTTWRVTTPINNYGVSFGMAPYEEMTKTYASPLGYEMPVTFYVLPERRADAERVLPEFLDHIRFLEETFGPYAFRADGYDVLHTPYLGMEHQSLIAYGSDFSHDASGFDWLHFHELAHEWFANLATAPDWRDFWVHESFANYAEALYAEDLAERDGRDGHAAYIGRLARSRGGLLNVQAVAPRETRSTMPMYELPDGRFNGDIYSKGAWVLHTLRGMIGDEAFFAALPRITYPDPAMMEVTDGRQTRFVSTADVQRAFEDASGRDLTAFFEVYLRQPDLPRLDVVRSGGEVTLRWVTPEGTLADNQFFEVPVEVVVNGETQRLPMNGGVGTLAVSDDAEVTVDPDRWVLRAE